MQLQRIIQALPSGIEFILVGGIVIQQYLPTYQTQDVDVLYRATPANWQLVIQWLHPFQPIELRIPGGTVPLPWDARTPMASFTLTTAAGDIDLLQSIAGVGDYDQALPHTVPVPLWGKVILMLDLPTLIISKRATGRQKDREILPDLERLPEP